MEEKDFQQPEEKIQLLDGRILDCYPLELLQDEVNNNLSLDTTSVYLSLKKPKRTETVKNNHDNEEKELEKLFLENAFVFLENQERILSDSRMFLCPLPFSRSGLAYTGTGGFRNPTLGVFIEFWNSCPPATTTEENGKKWLVYHIAGSPLSGSNRCGLVNPQGETKCEQITSFIKIWPLFIDINTRYDKAKRNYDSYTLRQVLCILENEGVNTYNEKNAHIFFLEQTNKELKTRMRSLKAYTDRIYTKLHQALLELKRENLKEFMLEYKDREQTMAYRLTQIRHERLELRKRLKANEIDNIQYQKLWMPIHKEKEKIVFEMEQFVYNTLQTLYPDDNITLNEVKNFIDKTNNNQ